MHANNLHKHGYDFTLLTRTLPALQPFVIANTERRPTINFSDPLAVKLLNQALLKHYYNLTYWDIPDGFLCPPIPGRADYICHIADLLNASHIVKNDNQIIGLDIGVGANLVYPIVGSQVYQWDFIGSEINPSSLASAQRIIDSNTKLAGHIRLRPQCNADNIFKGIILPQDTLTFTMCNPPFHASAAQAISGTQRKNRNLGRNKQKRGVTADKQPSTSLNHLNFAGQQNELWCNGGEVAFIRKMINESQLFAKQVRWFTCLVSKKEHLTLLYQQLEKVNANEVKTVNMSQGSKISRFIAWRF
ncbi:23S rRNA (adenine(1618)-N(6))-methyltransferase RlmF [Paraglaciecola sp.]|uniref:23S rRNA (adenine(1618)-N(6))-methyltransferase RlmF n=1 Tax=Paraglaciecola sp. TaxID=1920173 RepID=UPI00273E8873|nr:23S rRNA (adenine(1618)-N(6))-methyltransferase RlmF [Paraglaciecola sp.]MDP5031603.1 23S rRNA (adenine(1618)-N(6))-methyltransferase RlmF [Paraglaciecola sp.]